MPKGAAVVPQGTPRACSRGCGKVGIPGPIAKHERRCLLPFTLDRLLEAYSHLVRDEDSCWPGSLGIEQKTPDGQRVRLYVIAAVLAHGHVPEPPSPGGRVVCHRCDNRDCWNPSHLYVGTATDNMADAIERSSLLEALRSRQVELTCASCGGTFKTSKSTAAKRKTAACSRECRLKLGTKQATWLHATPEQKADWTRKANEGRARTRARKASAS